MLSACQYEIQYKRSEQHENTDALSRLPVKGDDSVHSSAVYRISYLEKLPVSAKEIAHETEGISTTRQSVSAQASLRITVVAYLSPLGPWTPHSSSVRSV